MSDSVGVKGSPNRFSGRPTEETLLEVFELAGDALIITDHERRMAEVNAAACALTQYSREELATMTALDLLDPCQVERFKIVREGDSPVDQWRIRRKDGAWIDIEIKGRRLSDGRRLSVVRDISEEKARAADQRTHTETLNQQVGAGAMRVAEAERQRQRFWDASKDLLAIIPASTGVPTLINEHAWQATLGYPGEQIMSRRLVELAHPDDIDSSLGLKHTLAAGGAVYGFENRYRHADGHWVWLSWNVVREGDLNYSIARDVTADKASQQALAESERQFRLLVAGVVDYALFMLNPDGTVASWNVGAERIKGYHASEIVGRHISQFYTEVDRAAALPDKALLTAKEQGRYEAEAWRVRKDGSLFFANVVIDAIHDETGALIGFAKITRDITERQSAQHELQRAHERLAQSQKLEAIGQLTGGVAHDFNNLLMVVGGQTELLRRRLGDDARTARALDAIDTAARRGQDLTRHLLAFARRQRLRPVAVPLATRADGLRELLAASVGSAVTLSVDLPQDLWSVEVDPGELELAILNLAVNARDAMPTGGALSVVGRNVTLSGREANVDIAGDFVELIVRDTGVGIPADILPKVFEPFFSTKEVNKGTGLGLSQVYGFVQQSNGRVTVASELGEGAIITIYLPRTEAQPLPVERPAAVPEATNLQVLVVEDNPEVADVAAAFLEQLGHGVRVVGNAAAALDLLQGGDKLDLVFSDIVMAGEMDGLQLARHIRERWPDLPVLLASGYSQAAERMGAEFPILAKPYQLADLNRALGAAVAKADAAS
jgi:PAS domain S-box-containing protein